MCVSRSVLPNSVGYHGLQPSWFLLLWDYPGKDTGVGCHLLLQRAYRNPQISCSWQEFPQDKRIKMISASFLAHTPSLNLFSMCAVLSWFWLFATPWTGALHAPLSMGILQARIREWIAMPSFRGSSQPRDQTQVFHIAGGLFTEHQESPKILESAAYPFSRASSPPRHRKRSPALQADSLPAELPGKPLFFIPLTKWMY